MKGYVVQSLAIPCDYFSERMSNNLSQIKIEYYVYTERIDVLDMIITDNKKQQKQERSPSILYWLRYFSLVEFF